MRSLDSAQTTPLPGTEDAVNPFFSPDGQWIGFFAGGKLMKINVLGGAPVTLCDVRGVPGGSWGEDDEIIVSGAGSGLSGVPASGGSLRPVTQLDAGKGEFGHFYPQVLPGGAAVLFTAGLSGMPGIEVQTLRTGQRKTLVTGAYFGRYAPSGHLLYLQQGTLFAASMDLKRLELTGQPRPVLQNLETDFIKGYPQFDFSRTGTFATFLSSSGQSTRQTLRWLEPSGQPQALPAVEPADYNRLRLSPDGKRLAEIIIDGTAGSLWIRDLQAERVSRLTFKGSADAPAWTPDGAHIAYYLSAGTKSGIYWTRADGAGEPVLLREKPLAHPDAFSPEGKWLMYHVHGAGGETSIWKLSVDANDPEHPRAGQPEAFLQGPSSQEYASFSPDGRFIAYKSNESGREEVYVRPFPGPGGKWLISGEGGTYPLWSRSAHELLYFGFDGRIQVTDYTVQGDSFVAAKPRPWSPAQVALKPSLFDLMPDGKRMVMALPQDPTEGGKSNTHVTMLVNFFDDLRLRAPVGK
ncbi:MAG: hypothetical protein ABSG41_06105 [Bryobacteraceae bacterium]